MAVFPRVSSASIEMQFFADHLPSHEKPTYSLVIPFAGSEVVLCNINGRGWCIPSGIIEPNESPEQAAIREASEEAFISLESLTFLGYYILSAQGTTKYATLFSATVATAYPIQPSDEVSDRRFSQIDELPAIYYDWNPLMAAVFDYALKNHSSD